MSVLVTERFDSRRLFAHRDGKQSRFELLYNVAGTNSESVAKYAVEQQSPSQWGIGTPKLYRQSISVEVAGVDLWLATVNYDSSFPEPLAANDSFEFDTSGGTQHVTQSLATVGAYPPGAPDFEGAIGVSDSGVEGVDITVPQLTFTETHYYAELAPIYKGLLVSMTGRVNSTSFRGFEPGEVLFLGARARKEDNRADTPWSVVYQFAVQLNRTDFFVGSIPVAVKLGWDYMWIRYESAVDEAAGALVQRPVAVYVERVYETADFTGLGIGS